MQRFCFRQILPLAIIASMGFALQSCQDTSATNSTDPATLIGQILDRSTSIPLEKVIVKILPFNRSAETGADGKYSLAIELPDSNSTTVTLIFAKTGFVSDTLRAVTIQNGHTTTLPEMKLAKVGSDNSGPSGNATHIVLVKVTTSSIFVAGTGGQATSDLIFEARDANGITVDSNHKVTLNFRISGGPGGGESISPSSALTDENGRATTTITSGTVAGALQVVAEIQGKAIASAPVPIAIHGGLPHRDHFSLALEKLNIAGLVYFGLQDRITAYVGDRYSNPVPPGTVVQFQSTGGIIEGSAVTNTLGQASVRLVSAAPLPPIPSDGLVAVIAETVDETRTKIKVIGKVLFSGPTVLTVEPTTFTIAPLESKTFNYTVSDLNGNPLVAGSTYTVSTDNGEVTGATSVNMKDTQSKAATKYSFVLTNSKPDSLAAKAATIKIAVNSENGDVIQTITGSMLPKK